MQFKDRNGNPVDVSIKDYLDYKHIWSNNGLASDNVTKMSVTDALSVPNAPMLFPRIIANVVKEAAEPLLVGTSLLTQVNTGGGQYGQIITLGATGALYADDIPEGGEYPERSPDSAGGTVTAKIGKSGLAIRITEEMVRYSQFDVIGMMLRKAGQALARHKEQKIFNMIRSEGVTVFDNVSPLNSLKGVLTGRDIHGVQNGSVTMDDLFDTFAHVMMQGFMPNTLLMHPLTWTMFIKDPVLRAFALANGGGTYFANWTGRPNGQFPWANSSQNGLGVPVGQNVVMGPSGANMGSAAGGTAATPVLGFPQDINSAPVIPSYFNIPMRIIVSPFVPINMQKRLTDIYMFDSNELGVLFMDEDVTTEEFNDPRVDIRKIKVRERYALGVLNAGQGIGVMRNVHLVPNELVLPATATVDVSGGQITGINPLADVL